MVAGTEDPAAVYDVLSMTADERDRRGRRHELATVLVVAVVALRAGARSLAGIAGWATDPATGPAPAGDQAPTTGPVHDPRGPARRRPDVLDAVRHAWVAALTPPPAVRAVADGKTCRGARRADGTRMPLFSVVEHSTGVPLGQVLAESKGHEIAAFATLLDRIDLTGVVVTADALCRARHNASYAESVVDRRARSRSGLGLPRPAGPVQSR